MKIPKEIAEKAKIFQEASAAANRAFEEVVEWLKENTEADSVDIEDLFVTDEPTGSEQGEGEFCEQHSVGWCEDSFAGKYYHPIEDSNFYLGYEYSC